MNLKLLKEFELLKVTVLCLILYVMLSLLFTDYVALDAFSNIGSIFRKAKLLSWLPALDYAQKETMGNNWGIHPHKQCKGYQETSEAASLSVLSSNTDKVSSFQTADATNVLHVYSAFLNDVENPPVVTVVALGELKRLPGHVTCRYGAVSDATNNSTKSFQRFEETLGNVTAMPDDHGRQFGAVFVHCGLPRNGSRPDLISLATDTSYHSPNHLTVHLQPLEPHPPCWNLVMCLSPLFGPYSDSLQIIETFELAQILGADHAVGYVTDVTDNVSLVLKHYVTQGFLQLHPWRSPPHHVHYYGQIAAINDCLLRMRHLAKLLVYTDLDEVIVPRMHKNWDEMLRYVQSRAGDDSSNLGEYQFRNAYYYLSPSNVSKTPSGTFADREPLSEIAAVDSLENLTQEQVRLARDLNLRTVLMLYRGEHVYRSHKRSKCIIDPLRVAMMGIHYSRILLRGYMSVVVNTSVALLNHYRLKTSVLERRLYDKAALRFAPKLVERVHRAVEDIFATAKNGSA